jgi:FkbM family methyltransferase
MLPARRDAERRAKRDAGRSRPTRAAMRGSRRLSISMTREASICSDGEYGPFEGSIHDEVVHGHYRRCGTWSPEIQDLLMERLFPEGRGTFLDIGANIGLVSIPLAERLGVRCLAFEPEPRNFRWLERNIAMHGVGPLFTTFNLALHCEEKRLCFELSASNFGDHRVRGAALPDDDVERVLIEVPASRLDDLVRVEDLPRPVVAKLDTQGAEIQILRGAERSLPHIDSLICEFWPWGLRRMGDRAEALIDFFRGFPCGAILGPEKVPGTLPSIDRLCARLDWLSRNRSDQGFLDVLVARHAELPRRREGTAC